MKFYGWVINFYLAPPLTFSVFPDFASLHLHRPSELPNTRFLSHLIATFLLLTFRENFSECNYAVHLATPLSAKHAPLE